MKSILLIIFGLGSFVTGLLFLSQALYLHTDGERDKRVLSPIQVFTSGIFIAVVFLFIPIYYTCYDFKGSYNYWNPLLIAIHNSIRIFILDGDFDIIVNSLEGEDLLLRICFSSYAAFLYVIAPVLTFGNVLSLFKNVKGEIRYSWHRRKKHYIMSELNEKSMALAKSIYKKEKKAVIVFTDVFEQNEEDDYELLTQARNMNAICLKKDISHMDFLSKKGAVEIFLIGSDESENVSQAVKITTELNRKNKKHNIKIFVFSTKPSASYIIDSIKYDHLLQHASRNGYAEDCFKLRRIDERQQLIWNTVPKMKVFDLAQAHDNTLSVMIVGFGSYGAEFFKMLVWYCQFEGYKLRISIIDKQGEGADGKKCIESLIERSCPELIQKSRSRNKEDALYDIEVFSDIDVLSADLDELLLYTGTDAQKTAAARRLKATNLAFVSLGDDDVNIEVSIHLRSLFDRINGIKAKAEIDWNEEAVDIYSVVYDDQKSGILYSDDAQNKDSHLLRNHKDVPYHIHFIGSMSSQFDYQNIYSADLERSAYTHHSGWVAIEEAIYQEWQKQGDLVNLENHEWYFQGEKDEKAVEKTRKRYEQYEYYRRSSVAKELYQREIKANAILRKATTCLGKENMQTCQCENCIRRKRSEHLRWNAYTRVLGYSYNRNSRADRALLHDNLCAWEDLSVLDKQKD